MKEQTLTFRFPALDPDAAGISPVCRMTTLAAGSMRFRWDETNPLRDAYFHEQLSPLPGDRRHLLPIELIHSRTVFCAETAHEFSLPDGSRLPVAGAQGDGILAHDKRFVPAVTVADCMPIWFYDPETGCFGVLHSGWKGTGIAAETVRFAASRYGARPENMRFVLGPHIGQCCYAVDDERAAYFADSFTPDCVDGVPGQPRHLSLTKANLAVLEKAGVLPEHVSVIDGCTGCTLKDGEPLYASYRRQGPEHFKPMVAYAVWDQAE